MRYHNLIFENGYIKNLKDEIINLLAISSSIGIDNVKTPLLVKDLRGMGYEVDRQTILNILDEIEIVTSADSSIINISTYDTDNDEPSEIPDFEDETPFGGFDDEDDIDDAVDDAAKEKSMKDISK